MEGWDGDVYTYAMKVDLPTPGSPRSRMGITGGGGGRSSSAIFGYS